MSRYRWQGGVEVTVSASASEMVAFGSRLIAGATEVSVQSEEFASDGGTGLAGLRCELDTHCPDRGTISILLDGDLLRIVGGAQGLAKLGQSCLNVFRDALPHAHFHLDYFEGDVLIREADCSLIFECDSNVGT